MTEYIEIFLEYIEIFAGLAAGLAAAFYLMVKYDAFSLRTRWGKEMVFLPKERRRPFGLFLILCGLLLILLMSVTAYHSLFMFASASGIALMGYISFAWDI